MLVLVLITKVGEESASAGWRCPYAATAASTAMDAVAAALPMDHGERGVRVLTLQMLLLLLLMVTIVVVGLVVLVLLLLLLVELLVVCVAVGAMQKPSCSWR